MFSLSIFKSPFLFIFSGAVLVRKLNKLPRSKCWLVGYAETDAVEIANEFNRKYETDLRIGLNDCRDYTNGNKLFKQ